MYDRVNHYEAMLKQGLRCAIIQNYVREYIQ